MVALFPGFHHHPVFFFFFFLHTVSDQVLIKNLIEERNGLRTRLHKLRGLFTVEWSGNEATRQERVTRAIESLSRHAR